MKPPAFALCAFLAASILGSQVCPHTVTLQTAACPEGLNCQTTPGSTLISTLQFDQAMLDIAYLCENAEGAPTGTVSSVALTAPSWLSVSGSPITSTGTLAITAASGQTSGRVIGTCGSATSFGVCALTASDLPGLAALSGAVTDAQVPPDITITGTASKCARYDASGILGPATADCANGDTIGGSGGGGTEYDPDIPDPAVSYFCDDEWSSGADTCAWSWGNQGAATVTYQQGRIKLTAPGAAGESIRARWITAPSATDFTVCAKVLPRLTFNFNATGLGFLVAGSIATPTDIVNCATLRNNTVGGFVTRNTDYTTFFATLNDQGALFYEALLKPVIYMRSRYVASTKALVCGWSFDGYEFWEAPAQTLAANPVQIGIYANAVNGGQAAVGAFDFYRVRTDGTGTSDPWPCGGVP